MYDRIMTHLEYCMNLFGFTDITEITHDTLKKSFKVQIIKTHPDKGGKEGEFDNLLSAFIYLSKLTKRFDKGNYNLNNTASFDIFKEKRMNEIINNIFCEMEEEEFNEIFIKKHISSIKGYESWLRNNKISNTTNIKYGDIDIEIPIIEQTIINTPEEFNKIFENSYKKDAKEYTIVKMQINEMALTSGKNIGADLLNETDNFTSNICDRPGYTDLYSAFTSDNILTNKIPPSYNFKTLDELLEERKSNIKPLDDNELKELHEYEKQQVEKEKQHIKNVTEFFNKTSDTLITDNNNNNFIINIL